MSLATGMEAVAQTRPNVVLVIMDDVGIEQISDFNVGNPDNFALTPKISEFENNSLRFDDAWSTPLCSPTRATITTGRYGFRTGIGKAMRCDTTGQLDTSNPDLLPKRLKGALPVGYATALFGKWHLGEDPSENTGPCADAGLDRPILAGYDYFDGVLIDQ